MNTVKLTTGLVQGSAAPENKAVSVYKGIPFAEPPVGDLRWRPPDPVKPWDGVLDAKNFVAACPQLDGGPIAMFGPGDLRQSEDCLHINVWTPALGKGGKLPVMVWIHGGAFKMGGANNPMYNAVNLAAEGIVVVSCHYRMNVFGALAHPDLTTEAGASGSYAMLDQVAALEWVRDNIEAFGGDAGNVTIFGESAGSRAVALLVASPLAKGLFHRAICQSGGLRSAGDSLEKREKQGLAFAKKLGCGNVAALREIQWGDLVAASNEVDPFPFVDGQFMPDDPVALFDRGDVNHVPMIIGVNADEGTLFTHLVPEPVDTLEKYDAALKRFFGSNADDVRDVYPAANDGDALAAWTALRGDVTMGMPIRKLARLQAKTGSPCYFYQFTRVPPWEYGERFGAYHGAEIPYIFGSGMRLGHYDGREGLSETDCYLSDTLMGYWINFAKTGDPNGGGLPNWPKFSTDTEEHIEFGDAIGAGDHLGRERLDFLESLGEMPRTI